MPVQEEADREIFVGTRSGRVPSFSSQASFFLSGALAGTTIVPIEPLWQRFVMRKSLHTLSLSWMNARPSIYRSAVRFWVFDVARHRIQYRFQVPVWLVGGLSGAAGGFAEICAQSLAGRNIPSIASLANQSGKLFFCFGTYTYLSTTLSPEQLPPKPFWKCWLMGAAAGGVGSGIIARIEGIIGRALWITAVPKGALTIGTVIAVQVTSCAGLQQIPAMKSMGA